MFNVNYDIKGRITIFTKINKHQSCRVIQTVTMISRNKTINKTEIINTCLLIIINQQYYNCIQRLVCTTVLSNKM